MIDSPIYTRYYTSPLGTIEMVATDAGISSVYFVGEAKGESSEIELLAECEKQLDEYFNRGRKSFSLSLDVQGTDFQRRVWDELVKIPFGKVVSYLHIAKALGDGNLTRAVGNANGKNPVSIIVPCHRVIGTNGELTGYAGGMEKKKWLLGFEGVLTQQELFV